MEGEPQLAPVYYLDEYRSPCRTTDHVEAMETEQLELYEKQLAERIDSSVQDVLELRMIRFKVLSRLMNFGVDPEDGAS